MPLAGNASALNEKAQQDFGDTMMLHQESRSSMPVNDCEDDRTDGLSLIAYRSRACSMPSDAALQQLLLSSQVRNRAEGLTGVLVYEQGAYFQWLEGPTVALQRVWASILRDPRHHHVTVLRDEPVGNRVFDGWDLRIAQGNNVSIDATVAAMESSSVVLRRAIGRPPNAATHVAWEDIFATVVIPRLLAVHGRDHRPVKVSGGLKTSIWHAEPDSGDQLAATLICPREAQSSRFVDSLLARGASFNAMYHEVFEPAQRQLGKLWDRDLCDDFYLAIGLARLQMAIRQVNAAIPAEYFHKPAHRVLLSAQPNEPHCTGMIMSAEVFDRKGWQVMCHFPVDDQALIDKVETQWFDVLKLSQSGALRRDGRLPSIRATIDSARGASLNPSLIVMVDGRTFVERPQMFRAVHANADCVSALDGERIAERLLEADRTMAPLRQHSVS